MTRSIRRGTRVALEKSVRERIRGTQYFCGDEGGDEFRDLLSLLSRRRWLAALAEFLSERPAAARIRQAGVRWPDACLNLMGVFVFCPPRARPWEFPYAPLEFDTRAETLFAEAIADLWCGAAYPDAHYWTSRCVTRAIQSDCAAKWLFMHPHSALMKAGGENFEFREYAAERREFETSIDVNEAARSAWFRVLDLLTQA